jgi:hypothetical protein
MDTNVLFTFRFLKILKSHVSKFQKNDIKYIDRHIRVRCMQKSPVKNTLYFEQYKKDKFMTVNGSKKQLQ